MTAFVSEVVEFPGLVAVPTTASSLIANLVLTCTYIIIDI
jgi:hypothetical protein